MVSLVIVSHSSKLAEGVVELMRGMAGTQVKIAAAGGMDLPDHPLGTDANLIHRAILDVYSPDGVAVLVDLGSAILSAELALEMLSPEEREHVVIAPAPLVEGGIAAAVQARLGSDLNAVVNEARNALDAKLAQLGGVVTPPQAPAANAHVSDYPLRELVLPVNNLLGLHARPAARFVQTSARFDADVRIEDLTNGRGPANAKSINAVTTLGVLHGHEIKITARGPDASAVLQAIEQLAKENFGDEATALPFLSGRVGATPTPPRTPAAGNEFVGLAASPGYAIGAARLYHLTLPDIPQDKIQNPEREWRRLTEAVTLAQSQLRQARKALNGRGDSAEAGIFEAQVLMLADEALQEPARQAIFERHDNAALAFDHAAAQIIAQYEALEDEYLRARAEDVRAVSRQVLINLLGTTHAQVVAPGILVAPELTPAETVSLDPALVQAICTAFGGPTGHSAILAKSLGIPAVVGLGEIILAVNEGETLLVDGAEGRVWVNPDAALVQTYTALIEGARAQTESARLKRNMPAITQDGRRVEIAANIGSLADARLAVEMGAEAVGLFRTEFLFLDRREAPGEDEQYETYRAIASALQGRPLLLRTLDIGGDKPLPYAAMPPEANPFLGLRGLRLTLAEPALFKTQLRAVLRVAAEFPNLRLMYPMVSHVQEFRAAQALLNEARAELQQLGVEAAERIETGIMVEVPGAALAAAHFAREVDFFSIGTNDLIQYTLAAERGNPAVAALADPFHPAVLTLIDQVVTAAHAQSKWVGVCGEMGGDPEAIPLLIGLGVNELSMSPPLIPRAKELVRGLRYADASELARVSLK